MKITSQYTLPLPRHEIWPYLQDPQLLAHILPGCTHLAQTAVNEFSGQITIPNGPAKGDYAGRLALSNIEEPIGYNLEFTGSGNNSFIHATAYLQLNEHEAGTAVQFDGQAKIGGRLASLNDRMLTTTANALMRHGFEALEAKLLPQNGATAVLPTASTTQPNSRIIPASLAVGLLSFLSLATLFLGLRQLYRWWLNRLTQRIINEQLTIDH